MTGTNVEASAELVAPQVAATPTADIAAIPAASDRKIREEERRPYPYVQSVAPLSGDRWPHRSEFVAMTFNDLSQRGFSFYTDVPPATPNVVVELGQKPKCIYFIAKIMHCSRDAQDAQGRFRVGCRFIKRIPYWGQTGS